MQVVFDPLYLFSSAHRQGHRVTSPMKGSNPTTAELQSQWTFFFVWLGQFPSNVLVISCFFFWLRKKGVEPGNQV